MVMDNSIHTDEQTDNAINNFTFEEESEVGKVVSNWTGLDWTCCYITKSIGSDQA